MDEKRDSRKDAIEKRSDANTHQGQNGAPPRGESVEANSTVRTFYRFRDRPTAGGVKSVMEEGSRSTANTLLSDWVILYRETVPLVALARSQRVSVETARDIAPNLAHWVTDKGIQRLLKMCSSSGDDDSTENMNLNRRGRRKDVPVTDYLDRIVAKRVGKTVETVRSYRQRGARASRKNRG